MYPQQFGAIGATPTLRFNLNPAFVQCIKSADSGGVGGKWIGDQVTGYCQAPGSGIPTWVYVAGGVAIVGAAAYYFMGK